MLKKDSSWQHLGKKTFWIFVVKHSKLFLVFFVLGIIFTYSIVLGDKKASFDELILTYEHLYISKSLILMTLWLALLGFLIVILLYSLIIYRQYKFKIDQHAFYVRRGVFFVKESVIPYRQIQNVEINRPYIYRLIGLAELDLTTFSNAEFNGNPNSEKAKHLLPLIDYKVAKSLSEHLIQRGNNSNNE